MKKQILSMMLALVLCIGLLPTAAFAEESTALTEAGTVAEGTYYLEGDLNGDLEITGNVTLDLRGHDIIGSGTGQVILVRWNGNLTLKDGFQSQRRQA